MSPPRDNGEAQTRPLFPEVFLFDYGVVVFWGMSLHEEQKFMQEIEAFEEERLGLVITFLFTIMEEQFTNRPAFFICRNGRC
jgi:uncharacterized Rmd1/YagE family protein